MTKIQQKNKTDNPNVSIAQTDIKDDHKTTPKPFEKAGKLKEDEIKKIASNYKRIGTEYYLYATILTAKKKPVKILKRWRKTFIKEDHGTRVFSEIEKFVDFALVPDNTNTYKRNIGGCYNIYEPINYTPIKGEFKKTETFLEHIFGEYLNVGLDYLTLLYLKPAEKLPALCLVSKEQKTGKSTFLHWLQNIYGDNAVILGNEDFSSNFNTSWASKLIIGLDESFIEKRIIKEKIKRLVTDDNILAENKGVDKIRRDFIGKFILLSNNEDNFIQMDSEDNRFFVLKVPTIEKENPFLLEEMAKEVPAFLYFLKERKLYYEKKEGRLWFSEKVYETEALKKVVKSSKTILEKTMVSYFSELVDTISVIEKNEHEKTKAIKITPMRLAETLKEKIRYSNGLHIKINEIFRTWKIEPTTKPGRYKYPVFKTEYFADQEERIIKWNSEIGRYFTIPFSKINELNKE